MSKATPSRKGLMGGGCSPTTSGERERSRLGSSSKHGAADIYHRRHGLPREPADSVARAARAYGQGVSETRIGAPLASGRTENCGRRTEDGFLHDSSFASGYLRALVSKQKAENRPRDDTWRGPRRHYLKISRQGRQGSEGGRRNLTGRVGRHPAPGLVCKHLELFAALAPFA